MQQCKVKKFFPLRSGTRQRCLFLQCLVSIVLEVLDRVIKGKKERERNKRQPNWKEIKLYAFVDAIILIFSSVQSLSHVQIFANPWTAACQASLPITNSQSLLKPMSIKLVMPSNHLILYHPLLLLPSICPNMKVFSNKLALCIR